MIKIRRYGYLYLFLACEFFCFLAVYYGDTDGIPAVWRMHHANQEKKQMLCALKKEIEDLRKQVHEWETNIFYKEKVAREQLQMVGPDDTVYYVMSEAEIPRV